MGSRAFSPTRTRVLFLSGLGVLVVAGFVLAALLPLTGIHAVGVFGAQLLVAATWVGLFRRPPRRAKTR